ncbi:hypothetical protein NYE80_31020 [Paenibacillus sp. FSL H7-0357]|uniref:hypothetical protein n=1 Tax=Paenibacillus sp. FSL H7-0357 TaxID=1536774 RepID=UPI0030CF0FF1
MEVFTERGNDVTIFLLIKAIQTFLENELVDDAFAVPNVYLGDLPPNSADSQEDPEYPFIIIRPFEGEGGKDNIQSQIKLLFRTRPRDNSGFIDLLNLMERVRILLMRQGILEKKFAINDSWKWKLIEEQPMLEWVGEVITTWTLPQIKREVKI